MNRLTGKVAIVTGVTGAMGTAIAKRLSTEGASVVGVGRRQEAGAAVTDALHSRGGQAIFVQADISTEDDVRRVVTAATDTYGRLDLIVNNAAAMDAVRTGSGERPVADEPTELFDYQFKVNVYGPFWLAKFGVPEMVRAGGGAVVSVSSITSVLAHASMPGYVSSKAALEALTRQIAVDYGPEGVRANSLLVGSIKVPGNAAVHDDPASAESKRRLRMLTEVGRPEDVAAAVAFLASDDAAYITGTTLAVDGGVLAKFADTAPAVPAEASD